ncbi:hypothetical protein MRX96_024896 [Rhipicephalus microplus]
MFLHGLLSGEDEATQIWPTASGIAKLPLRGAVKASHSDAGLFPLFLERPNWKKQEEARGSRTASDPVTSGNPESHAMPTFSARWRDKSHLFRKLATARHARSRWSEEVDRRDDWSRRRTLNAILSPDSCSMNMTTIRLVFLVAHRPVKIEVAMRTPMTSSGAADAQSCEQAVTVFSGLRSSRPRRLRSGDECRWRLRMTCTSVLEEVLCSILAVVAPAEDVRLRMTCTSFLEEVLCNMAGALVAPAEDVRLRMTCIPFLEEVLCNMAGALVAPAEDVRLRMTCISFLEEVLCNMAGALVAPAEDVRLRMMCTPFLEEVLCNMPVLSWRQQKTYACA